MPVVGAHFYIGDVSPDHSIDTIPTDWYYARFDDVDILYVGPVWCRQTNHIFSLQYVDNKNPPVDYSVRFEWVIKHALRDFLASWQRKKYVHAGKPVSLRVDGYDVEYKDGNTVDIVTKVYEKIRGKVDKFTVDNNILSYLLSLTPATSKYVKDIAPFVDYIKMQNYDRGIGVSAEQYRTIINPLPPSKLIWGLHAEATFKNYPKVWNENTNSPMAKVTDFYSIDEQLGEVSRLQLGGSWVWRLTSDNWVYENAVQLYVYNKLHPEAPKVGPAGLDVNVRN
ncbi:MAG: hypothetical protein Q9214_004375, partial [Letrouitia sp. 1 TL-2023]